MPLIKRSSYYNPDYRQGPALIRARSPYLIKNTLTGLGLAGLVVGIYVYTIRAIKSDDFEDAALPAPSPIAPAAVAPVAQRTGATTTATTAVSGK